MHEVSIESFVKGSWTVSILRRPELVSQLTSIVVSTHSVVLITTTVVLVRSD